MITREVPLHHGLTVGSGKAMIVTIREESAEDELAELEAGHSGRLLERKVTLRRIVKLGTLDHPDEAILRKLPQVDLELIERDMVAMDIEIKKAAGLLKEEPDASREGEPGAETPGAA